MHGCVFTKSHTLSPLSPFIYFGQGLVLFLPGKEGVGDEFLRLENGTGGCSNGQRECLHHRGAISFQFQEKKM